MDLKAIPTCPDEVTPAWLTAVLRSRGLLPACAVSCCHAEPLGTQGMTSEAFRVRLDYDAPAPVEVPRTLVLKLASADSQTRATMQALGAYRRELRFYDELAPAIGVSTPHCFAAVDDAESGRFALMLEEVRGSAGISTVVALQ